MSYALKKTKGSNFVFACFCNSTDCLPMSKNIHLQMGMNMKAWQNSYNFAHEFSGWLNNQCFKAILGCGYNK